MPAPPGQDADSKESLWDFERSRTPHDGDRRAAFRVQRLRTAHQASSGGVRRLFVIVGLAGLLLVTAAIVGAIVRDPQPEHLSEAG